MERENYDFLLSSGFWPHLQKHHREGFWAVILQLEIQMQKKKVWKKYKAGLICVFSLL